MKNDPKSCPINLIHGNASDWSDVAGDFDRSTPLDELAPRIRFGREIWIVQAFIALRDMGFPVSLTDRLETGAINIVHADDCGRLIDPWDHFVVSVRADRDPVFWAQVEVVQNRSSVWSKNDLYIPHWPQPGLKPRRRERLGRVETLVFMGHPWNLAPELHGAEFQSSLRRLGMTLEIREKNWWDYRECDVVLAVRAGTPFFLATKPASKLVNAWLAGCPSILGWEAAYAELRESPLDYLEANDAAGVLRAVSRLRDDPTLEQRMVEHGASRVREYSWDAVAERWAGAISGPILERFLRWFEGGAKSPIRKSVHRAQRLRRRLWGTQAVQDGLSSGRLRMNAVRRALAHPGARILKNPRSQSWPPR